jgi:hypothetical protein
MAAATGSITQNRNGSKVAQLTLHDGDTLDVQLPEDFHLLEDGWATSGPLAVVLQCAVAATAAAKP